MPFAISSLFLPKYCGILLFLSAWTREMLIINVIWFHVRQNCQMLLNSFTIFSFIFWKSGCDKIEESACIFTSRTVKVPQLIGNHACSMISLNLLKSCLKSIHFRIKMSAHFQLTYRINGSNNKVLQILISCK